MTHKYLAELIGISRTLLTQIFSGAKPVSLKSAQKFEAFTGRSWKDFLDMKPARIRQELENAAEQRQEPEATSREAVGL